MIYAFRCLCRFAACQRKTKEQEEKWLFHGFSGAERIGLISHREGRDVKDGQHPKDLGATKKAGSNRYAGKPAPVKDIIESVVHFTKVSERTF